MNQFIPILEIPPQRWVRLRGTRLEFFNEAETSKVITADLAGVHFAGILMRLAKIPVFKETDWVQIRHEEVKQDE